ncbi:RND family efflux transporter, MFP subunit [Limimonas halophila]|uniref:RND family efflux transporter, MFP subunit n=1 Tax=Limimonas halophila TaxID=1082479 RepID=A0A1G7RI33_9PROT|nr:RND family efflux transporter, MFP subunit [Limimonas halophila]
MTKTLGARRRQRAVRTGLLGIAALIAPAALAQSGAAPVQVEPVKTRSIVERVALSGTVAAPNTAEVSVAIAGKVVAAPTTEGERVEAGDTLVKLDPELTRLTLDAREAEVQQARAELSDARRRLETTRELAARNNAPQNEVRSLADQVAAREAALAHRRAQRERARAELDRHTVTAPFAGVVSHKAAMTGEWLDPGGSVVELIGLKRLRVEVPVPQQHHGKITPDTPVSVRLDAKPNTRFGARVLRTVPVSDSRSRAFMAHLRLAGDSVPMSPGMSARAHFDLATGERGPVIPRDALIRHPDGRETVWVLDKGEPPTVSERVIDTGLAFDGLIHVREGLKSGARVVVEGNEALTPGQRVRVVQADS